MSVKRKEYVGETLQISKLCLFGVIGAIGISINDPI